MQSQHETHITINNPKDFFVVFRLLLTHGFVVFSSSDYAFDNNIFYYRGALSENLQCRFRDIPFIEL